MPGAAFGCVGGVVSCVLADSPALAVGDTCRVGLAMLGANGVLLRGRGELCRGSVGLWLLRRGELCSVRLTGLRLRRGGELWPVRLAELRR